MKLFSQQHQYAQHPEALHHAAHFEHQHESSAAVAAASHNNNTNT